MNLRGTKRCLRAAAAGACGGSVVRAHRSPADAEDDELRGLERRDADLADPPAAVDVVLRPC